MRGQVQITNLGTAKLHTTAAAVHLSASTPTEVFSVALPQGVDPSGSAQAVLQFDLGDKPAPAVGVWKGQLVLAVGGVRRTVELTGTRLEDAHPFD